MSDEIEVQHRDTSGSPAFDPDPTQKIICWKQYTEIGPIPITPNGYQRNVITLLNVTNQEIVDMVIGLIAGLARTNATHAAAILASYEPRFASTLTLEIRNAVEKMVNEHAERVSWSTRA